MLLAACGGKAPNKAQSPSPEEALEKTAETSSEAPEGPDHAPPLFTLAQLRDGNPRGRVIELHIEDEGKPTTIERWELTVVDAESATIRAVTRDEAGVTVSDTTARTTWSELLSHSLFPADATTVEDNVSVTVPAGTFVTRLYTVTLADKVRRFWFSVEHPGPPVQLTTERGGTLEMRVRMLRVR